jgi:hypothetical protein
MDETRQTSNYGTNAACTEVCEAVTAGIEAGSDAARGAVAGEQAVPELTASPEPEGEPEVPIVIDLADPDGVPVQAQVEPAGAPASHPDTDAAAAGGEQIMHVPVSDLGTHWAARNMPDMRPEEWEAFLDDVKTHGVKDPLTVQKEGFALDGRHRLKAARECGQETVPVRVVDLSEEEQIVSFRLACKTW